MRLTIIHF